MKDFSWYLNRLSKMSPPEVLYRLEHKLREKRDERFYAKQPLSIPSGVKLSLSPLFTLTQHINLEQFPHWHNAVGPGFLDKADQYLENIVDVFGLSHDFGNKIDWHLDPKTGNHWPKMFWSKVNIRDGFTYGGPKFVWEANRLYALPALGLAYRATNKQKYADKFFLLVTEWLEGNPYPYGVNWTSGIELGIRIANLVWGLSFLQGYELHREHKETLNAFVYTHAYHLFRYPSQYSSNNNHAIAEAFGLFLIGVYFPYFENASQWRKFGQSVLERECLRQILPDGGSYEYSSTYLSFVFDFFLLFKIVCDNQGIEYDRAIDQRLEKSCEYIHGLMDEQGNMPNIGDQDSAVLVNFGLNNHRNFSSILNTGGVLFDRSDFLQNDFPDLKTLILLGKDNCQGYSYKAQPLKTITNKPTTAKTSLLQESGLGVIRGDIAGYALFFVGNATPLGMPPLYAHGHLDALSFYLSLAGREIFIDPGTYLYHCGGKWRRYFRSTAAHNTIRINQQDLTDMPGDFMFGRPYAITNHELIQENDITIWKASHDAYQHTKNPVFLKREISVEWKSSRIFLTDSITIPTNSKCPVELFFHLHPDCSVEISGNAATIHNQDITLVLNFDPRLKLKLFKGSEEPLAGWYSQAFNHLVECFTLVAAGNLFESGVIQTEIEIHPQKT